MRTLERNKVKLWKSEPLSTTPKLDADGFETGENITTYSEAVEIYLALQPANGKVAEQMFGKDVSLDAMTVTCEKLTSNSLLFLVQPTGNYSTTYDYRVSAINESLNFNAYALKRRT